MDKEKILISLQDIFRDIFMDHTLTINMQTNAQDIEGWDSLNHINIMVKTEGLFKVKFTTKEMRELSNVGDLVDLLEKKLVGK